MRILALHSRYRSRGGEDESFDVDVALLRERGDEVVEFVRHGAEFVRVPRVVGAARAVWNRPAATDLSGLLRAVRPDVAYVSNSFPALSASCLHALRRARLPVVFGVHNYRLACASGLLYRDGASCTRCVGRRVPVPAVTNRCYHGSTAASAAAAAATAAVHWELRRAGDRVTFTALSERVRRFLVDAVGIAADRVHLKWQTLRHVPAPSWSPEDFLLFAGRLEPEKGVREAIDAVSAVPGARLVVVGHGSLAEDVRRRARTDRVTVLGPRPLHEVVALMSRARATLMPSLWDEPFGRVAMESLACATPVVVGDPGGISDLVRDTGSGLAVPAHDAQALRAAVHTVYTDPEWTVGRRRAARAAFDRHLAPGVAVDRLRGILATAARHS
jgi:glycosyltransferase involved in cell wall biosynthesis